LRKKEKLFLNAPGYFCAVRVYSAGAVKKFNATSSLVRFESKNSFFLL
jgi:hypothetical protein